MMQRQATAEQTTQGPSAEAAGRQMRIATTAAVAVAALLIAAKLAAWLVTGSVAVMSSLIDSILDAGASLINLLAVRHALTPADREHRFGHGKAEALAGLAQSAFIAGSALFLLFEAVERLLEPRPVAQSGIGIAVIAFSMATTFGLVTYQRAVVRRTGSLAISADSLHYKGDLLANGAVIAALLAVEHLGWLYADPLLALAIAGYILYGATRIVRIALDQLMDRELPDEQRERIKAIVHAHPEVLSLHDLRTRASGLNCFIQLHLELRPEISLMEAHRISDEVERRILEAFPDAEVMIHQDPEGIDEERAIFPGPREHGGPAGG